MISCARHLSIYSSITSRRPLEKSSQEPVLSNINENQRNILNQSARSQLIRSFSDNNNQVDGEMEHVDMEISTTDDSLSTVSSLTSLESWCSEEDVTHYCEECAQRRTLAVPESLPPPVLIG